MENITQEELDGASRESVMIHKAEVMRIVKRHFCDAINSLEKRSAYDQSIAGNMLTVLELELKKDLKLIKEVKND